MGTNFFYTIRNKTREEWKTFGNETLTDSRIWIQEHGELAAIGGLVIGLIVAMFFKYFMILAVALVLGAAVVWYWAPTAEELARRQSAGVSINGHSNPTSKDNDPQQGRAGE